LNNEVIKGKPIRVGDQMGVRLETGRGDATEAFTIQDYTNELGSQLVDVNQQYKDLNWKLDSSYQLFVYELQIIQLFRKYQVYRRLLLYQKHYNN